MQISALNTNPNVAFDFLYVFEGTIKTTLESPYINLQIEPTRKDHRLVIDVPSFGHARTLVKSVSPYVTLQELGVDAHAENLVIIPDILAISGSIRIVADQDGLKAQGMKIDEIVHIFDYDLHINGAIMSEDNNAQAPADPHFTWCKKQETGENSWIWLDLTPRGRKTSLGQIGTWYTHENTFGCMNTIAIYKNKYHQIGVDNNANTKIELPMSYDQNRPIILEINPSEQVAQLTTPAGIVYAKLTGEQIALSIDNGKDTSANILAELDLKNKRGKP